MAVSTTAQKLRIKTPLVLRTVNAPKDFSKNLGPVPPGTKISSTTAKYDQVHWFVTSRAQMEEELDSILQLLGRDTVCWIYYPKGSSGLQTDLTRDKGWEELLKHEELTWISLISFDETWSAFGMRHKKEADRKKEASPRERPIFEYIDPQKKLVYLPDDFAAALKKAKKQEAFFQTLSFTNKKEYLEWIVSAKRAETRAERIKGSIERLGKEWKNPANR